MFKFLFFLALGAAVTPSFAEESIPKNELFFGGPDGNVKRLYIGMPKAELHLHLGGAYPLDYLRSIANGEDFLALEKALDQIAKGVSYHNVFSVFQIVSRIVNTEEKIEQGTFALCQELERDRVTYAEIRTSLKNLGKGEEEYLQAVLRGMKRSAIQTRLLLSLWRSSSLTQAQKTVDLALKYQAEGIVGIDISGDSTIGEISPILPELLRAKTGGLFLTLHIGESPKERQQRELLEILKPDRIGHGVFLEESAKEWILANRTPIEMCLSSAYLVQMIADPATHPALEYFALGHPIAICTDDPLIFRTSLSQEIDLVSQQIGLSAAEEIARNAFDYTFDPSIRSRSK